MEHRKDAKEAEGIAGTVMEIAAAVAVPIVPRFMTATARMYVSAARRTR
jgi:hypothetical protein